MHRSPRRDTLAATRHALRSLARRHQTLDAEIAARLLLVAGDNPTRLRNDAALAALCGASPIEASSGKTVRHRLNRGGDRRGNSALWLIANNRMIHHPQTRDYVARRTADGKSTREIRRCLMRHIARGLYPLLIADLHDSHQQSALT